MNPVIGIIDDGSVDCHFFITMFREQGYTVLTLAPSALEKPLGGDDNQSHPLRPKNVADWQSVQSRPDALTIPILRIRTDA